MQLGPRGAVPGPGVIQVVPVVAAEQDDVVAGGVVDHVGVMPGRRRGGRVQLGPGGPVPGPGVIQVAAAGERAAAAAEQQQLAGRGVVDHGRAGPWRRCRRRLLLGPGGPVPGPRAAQYVVRPGGPVGLVAAEQHHLARGWVIRPRIPHPAGRPRPPSPGPPSPGPPSPALRARPPRPGPGRGERQDRGDGGGQGKGGSPRHGPPRPGSQFMVAHLILPVSEGSAGQVPGRAPGTGPAQAGTPVTLSTASGTPIPRRPVRVPGLPANVAGEMAKGEERRHGRTSGRPGRGQRRAGRGVGRPGRCAPDQARRGV